jgi:hypothetical protein
VSVLLARLEASRGGARQEPGMKPLVGFGDPVFDRPITRRRWPHDVPPGRSIREGSPIYEKALGPDHRIFAQSLNNLAEFYYHQDRHAEVEPLFRRALPNFEKALGPDPNGS